jgi:hypothetical protein
MGALSGMLTVAVGPGAAVTVFASALVTWIRHRTGTAHVRVSWPDGAEIELSADRLGQHGRGSGPTCGLRPLPSLAPRCGPA